MSAIQYALREIKTKIPKRILELAFLPKQKYGNRINPFMPATVDDMIIEKVINDKVRRDCDTSGYETEIPLAGIVPEIVDKDKFLLHIPKQLTQGRDIVGALSVIWYSINGRLMNVVAGGGQMIGRHNPMAGNPYLAGTNAFMNSVSSMPVVGTANCRLLDNNTVLVESMMLSLQYSYLKCLLSNDSQFSNIPQRAYRHFSHLCVLAVGAYIYNELVIEMDEGELVAGQNLGVIKDIVGKYEDYAEKYDEYFTDVMQNVLFQTDHKRNHDYLKAMVGRFI